MGRFALALFFKKKKLALRDREAIARIKKNRIFFKGLIKEYSLIGKIGSFKLQILSSSLSALVCGTHNK